jgi:ribosomal protein S18 acetylase RimI-like enzyme
MNLCAFPNKGKIVVFEVNQQIIGYAVLVWVWTNEFGSDILWIDEIAIEERNRGKGIGKKFFSWLQTEYGNSPAFSLLVSDYNHKAKKLYQEIGFKQVQTQMLKLNNVVGLDTAVKDNRELVEAF